MIKALNVVAIFALIGSATAAYSVKYETILMAEKLKKREAERAREQNAIAVLQAEWNLLNRPERLAKLAPPEAGMQVLTVRQIARAIDIPQAGAEVDSIAKALDGTLTGSLTTPDPTRKTTGRTPGTPTPSPLSPKPRIAGAPMPLASTPAPPSSIASLLASPLSPSPRAAAPIRPASSPPPATSMVTLRPPARVPDYAPAAMPQKSAGAAQPR